MKKLELGFKQVFILIFVPGIWCVVGSRLRLDLPPCTVARCAIKPNCRSAVDDAKYKSFAFALYKSSSYGAKLKIITAHYWSLVFFLLCYQFEYGYCWWMQDTHRTLCIAQTSSRHILPLLVFPVSCKASTIVSWHELCAFFFPSFLLIFPRLKSRLYVSATYSL